MNPVTKVAVVTGGTSGIGRSSAHALALAGYRVAVVGRREAAIRDTLSELRSLGGEHLGLSLDVTRADAMQEMAERTRDRFGRIDLLVASAGIGRTASAERLLHPTAELPLAEWQAVFDVNLHGIFYADRAVLPIMLAQGRGHILHIGSSTTIHGLRGQPYAPAYCASKFALVGLTESLAQEVEAAGIRVQLLFPGAVETPLVEATALARPFGGAIAADHLGQVVLYLAEHRVDAVLVHPHLLPCFETKPKR